MSDDYYDRSDTYQREDYLRDQIQRDYIRDDYIRQDYIDQDNRDWSNYLEDRDFREGEKAESQSGVQIKGFRNCLQRTLARPHLFA